MPLATYQHFADRDPLSRLVLEQMLAGVSTRRFGRTREPVGEQVEAQRRSTSKSSVSRDFVAKTKENLIELMSRRLEDVRLAALMLDGIELKGRCCVVALGIDTDGVKHPARAVGRLDRERDRREGAAHQPRRPGPGSRAGRAVRDRRRQGTQEGDQRSARAGARPEVYPSQGAQRARPPRRTRPSGRQAPAAAGVGRDDHDRALAQLQPLAGELEHSHPGAAASLREGLDETLTVTRLGVKGALKRTLQSTNPCESMIETVRRTSRNVKRWQSGEMCLRWTAAGMLEAERQFRRIIGHADLAKLALAVERELHRHTATTKEVTASLT